MDNLLEKLKQAGFKPVDKREHKLVKQVLDGYSWTVCLVDGTWDEFYEVGFYLNSPLFSKVMDILFSKYQSTANQYDIRTLPKDKSGCLGFASVGWDEAGSGEMAFYSARRHLTAEDFIATLEAIKSVEDIYELIYEGFGVQFLAVVEGIWVYLYLLKQRGLNKDEILLTIEENESGFPVKVNKPLDVRLIEAFELSYNEAKEKGV